MARRTGGQPVSFVCTLALLLPLLLGGCLHGSTRHDYAVSVQGKLVDGEAEKPVAGLHVTVKAGEEVIYDGYTDGEGMLSFTYERSVTHRRGDRDKGGGLTVLLQVETGEFGVVEVPLKLGESSGLVSLGDIQLGPGKGTE